MKRRLICLILSLCLMVSLLPFSALATVGGDDFPGWDPDYDYSDDGEEPLIAAKKADIKLDTTPSLWAGTALVSATIGSEAVTLAAKKSGYLVSLGDAATEKMMKSLLEGEDVELDVSQLSATIVALKKSGAWELRSGLDSNASLTIKFQSGASVTIGAEKLMELFAGIGNYSNLYISMDGLTPVTQDVSVSPSYPAFGFEYDGTLESNSITRQELIEAGLGTLLPNGTIFSVCYSDLRKATPSLELTEKLLTAYLAKDLTSERYLATLFWLAERYALLTAGAGEGTENPPETPPEDQPENQPEGQPENAPGTGSELPETGQLFQISHGTNHKTAAPIASAVAIPTSHGSGVTASAAAPSGQGGITITFNVSGVQNGGATAVLYFNNGAWEVSRSTIANGSVTVDFSF